LIISFSILRQEIIIPLSERITQVEAVHKVSLAITSQIGIDTVLNQIATQAVNWLNADGAAIFLSRGEQIEVVTVFNLPQEYLHVRLPLGHGVAGTVAKTSQTIHLENYDRDWKYAGDLPLARETFGSVISIPLIYGGTTIGVLMVVASKQGRLFQREDANLLELLGSQAAVAVAHSHFFAEQNELTKQVEAARNQLEIVLSSTGNPVIAIDKRLKIIFANEAAKTLFKKLTVKDMIEKALPQEKLPIKYKEMAKELRQKRSYTREIEIDHKIYLCHITQLGHSKTRGWVAILNDITQLKELDRMKSEMIRMTSHDLKNPLQAAMANLELVTDDVEGYKNPEVNKSLEIINKQLLRMNRIIRGILDLERLKTITPSIDICRPKEIIENVFDDLETLATDQNITLAIAIEDNISNFLADPEQIKQAIINLVENAIKFTPKEGRVTVRAKKDNENIVFEVEDTGIGIPSNLQVQIFDRFLRGGQRGQSGAEHISGSGLGLSLVKTVIENHRGKIWLNSAVGKGTIFFISLPISNENTDKRILQAEEWISETKSK
jgi:signal transduction histidine kinase